jgi:lipopolysaccharide export system permease protein
LKLLFRYLLKEIAVPLVVGLGALFVLLLLMQFLRGADVLLGSSVTGRDLARLTLYLGPHFLVMAIPIAFLLALLIGLGRLGEDRELIALQSLGMGPWQILVLPMLLASVLGGVMLLLSFSGEPWGLTAVKGLVNDVIKRNVVGDVKPGVFYEDLTHLTVYAEEVDRLHRRWANVLLHDDSDPAAPLLVLAREAKVNPSAPGEALKLGLSDGDVHLANRTRSDYTILFFEHGEISAGVGESIFRKNRFRSPKEELTPGELLSAARAAEAEGGNPRPFMMAYHWRFGLALTPISFALIGTPLAMSRRLSRTRAYLLTIAGYVGYYVISRAFENMGSTGKLPLLIAGQLHNLLFAALGLWALFRLARAGTVR